MKRQLLLLSLLLIGVASTLSAQEIGQRYKTEYGYVGALTLAKMERVMEITASGDETALRSYIRQNKTTVTIIGEGLSVYLVEWKVWSGLVRLRVEGTTTEFWGPLQVIGYK